MPAFRLVGLGLLAGATGPALAAVDLVTIPTREGTQLTIYNSEDITMVREHRLLTVKEGVNRIQFSWANTLIDPTSIEFRILENQDKVDLVDTTFPAGRNDALQWNIKSKMAGKIPVEIRYFTSGITWAADYVGIANEDETKLAVTGYVRVFNNSGELYDNAQTRLVVGKINLVEKIADLATRPAAELQGPVRPRSGPRCARSSPSRPPRPRPAASRPQAAPGAGQARRQAQGRDQGGPVRVLPVHHRRPRGHQGQGAQAAGGPEGGRSAAGVLLQADRPRRRHSSSPSSTASRTSSCWTSKGKEKKLSAMENLGLSPLPNGMVRLFSEYQNKDLAYVGGTRDQVRAHRRPGRSERRRRPGHHHPPAAEGPADQPTSWPGSTSSGSTTPSSCTTT